MFTNDSKAMLATTSFYVRFNFTCSIYLTIDRSRTISVIISTLDIEGIAPGRSNALSLES